MAKNLVRKTLRFSGTVSIPAGVSRVKLLTKSLRRLSLSAGSFNGYAIKTDGSVWAWGRGGDAENGNNTVTATSSPVQTTGNHVFADLAKGGNNANWMLALKADGTIWGWGLNDNGQLGDNSVTERSSPVIVVGNHQFVEVAFGSSHAAARKADGSVWCWGRNDGGQLGDNTLTNKSSPVATVGGHVFVEICCGTQHVIALKVDGSAWCWGSAASGELGNNTVTSTSSPVAVTGGHVFVEVAAGVGYSVGRKADGSVWSWGNNTSGQLGDNTTTNKSSPVAVVGGHIFAQISASGSGHTLARKFDGSVWAWGINSNGSLGDNTLTAKSSPVAVAGGHIFVEVQCGSDHSVARKADGSVWGWGNNGIGQLGDNTNTIRSSPVQTVGNNFARMSIDKDSEIVKEFSVDVTPGSTISYSAGLFSFFGTTQLDAGTKEIVLEYFA